MYMLYMDDKYIRTLPKVMKEEKFFFISERFPLGFPVSQKEMY